MTDIRTGDIRYNPQAAAFEARVDIVRGGITFRYPCRLPAPVDLDPRAVRAGLVRQALEMSDSRFA